MPQTAKPTKEKIMKNLNKFVRKAIPVTAIQIDFDKVSFTYHKWGSDQKATSGDWIVNTNGDIFTVPREIFARSYKMIGHGQYLQTGDVWVRHTIEPGFLKTNNGKVNYKAGDYLVFNDPEGNHGIVVKPNIFTEFYLPISDV
jgi:hypothetical protein